ncbi:MAG: TRAP transporter substrate-binding protein [Betaproteobacteria bacterium]|nr:TRAP transporter substrate-binding protein [Betaproteobacteria bacterium]
MSGNNVSTQGATPASRGQEPGMDADRRKLLGGVAGVAAALGAPRFAAAAARYTLRLATWGSPKAPQVADFVAEFQNLVAQGSRGSVQVQSFPAGSLVDERGVPSAIQSRVVDIALTTMGSWASIVPTAGALNTVFFSPTGDRFEKIIGPGTPLFGTLDEDMAKVGVRMLATLYNGPVVVVSNFPMSTPAAFKGKTVRVFDRLTAQIVQTLGGAPSTIGVADVYPALQRGTVKAAIGGLEGAIGLKEYEVGKDLLATNGLFGILMTGYVMNKASLDALPANLQKVVLDAAYAAGRKASQAMVVAYNQELQEMQRHGMSVIELQPKTAPYEAFGKALEPLSRKQQAGFQPALVRQIIDAQR